MASNNRSVQSEQSKRVFWVIQTVFGVVLAKSLFDYKYCILAPFSSEYYLAALGIFLIYLTALWSWIDFSYTTIVYPYRFRRRQLWEPIRFIVDLIIVVMYASMLFSLEILQNDKGADISQLLWGFFIVFFLYWLSGSLRILRYGKRASRSILIIVFGGLYFVIAIVYSILYSYLYSTQGELLNVIFIVGTLVLMISYRLIRYKLGKRTRWIAIDVDGVLANQIEGILPIIKKNYGVDLKYDDVKEWDLKIKDTDIAVIIKSEQKHREYVTSMPMHIGANEGMDKLIRKHMIAVVTSRAPDTDIWTKNWLKANKIQYDEIIHVTEGNKQDTTFELAILIDDYIGNIKQFLENSSGKAILFSQPWNKNHRDLIKYIEEGRLKIVTDWNSVVETVKSLINF